jgi:hypothetical protein
MRPCNQLGGEMQPITPAAGVGRKPTKWDLHVVAEIPMKDSESTPFHIGEMSPFVAADDAKYLSEAVSESM